MASLCLLLLFTLFGTGAMGYTTSSGSGTGFTKIGELSAPTGVGASSSNATVTVSWTGATPPVGAHVTGYYVQRFKGSTPSAACGSSVSTLLAGTAASCTDTVPEDGTFTYRVSAVWRGWSATSAASSAASITAYPNVTSINPGSLVQGASSQTLTVTGSDFVSGSGLAASFSSAGITVNSTTYVSSTSLTLNVNVGASATLGASNVTVTNPNSLTGTCRECLGVYNFSEAANGGPTSSGTTVSSGSFTLGTSGNGYVVFASSESSSGDSATVSTSGFTTGPTATAIGSEQSYGSSANHNWAWSLAGGSGTGTVTITFAKATSDAYVFVIKAGGANNSLPVIAATEGLAESGGSESSVTENSTATAKLTGSPSSTNAELVMLSTTKDLSGSGATDSSSTITAISGAYLHNGAGSQEDFGGAGASTSAITLTLPGSAQHWGTMALEVNGNPVGVTSTSPSHLTEGESNKNVTVSGTAFESGATAAFSGSGVTVNSTTYDSATSVTVNISVSESATPSEREVTVTNPSGKSGSCTGCFIVTSSAPPTVTSVSAGSALQGASSQNLTVTGTGFQEGSELAAAFSSSGITVNSTTYNSATSLTVNVTVSASAMLGASNLTATNEGGLTGTCSECFYVYSFSEVAHAGPTSSGTTITSSSFTLSTSGNGYIVFASSISSSGDSAALSSSSFSSAPTAVAIGAEQSYGSSADHNWAWDLKGGSGSGSVTVTFAKATSDAYVFVIKVGGANNSAPVMTATVGLAESGGSESSATETSAATARLTGSPSSMNAELVMLSSSKDLGGSGATDSSSTITAISGAFLHNGAGSQEVFGGAPASASEVSLALAGPGQHWGTLALEISGDPVSVASTTPNHVSEGESAQNITITGTGFESGASASFSGSGITVNSTTYNSATSVTANVTVSGGATIGARAVTVTDSSGRHGSCSECFVVWSNAAPTVTAVSPSTGPQAGGTVVTLTGTSLNSATEVKFGASAGTSLAIVSETELRITSPSHSPGEVNVTVTNPHGTSSSTATYTYETDLGFMGIGTPTSWTSSRSAASVAYPAGTASGDLLLLVVVGNQEPGPPSNPSGWNGGDMGGGPTGGPHTAIYWKVEGSSESSVSVTPYTGGSSAAWVIAYGGGGTPAVATASSCSGPGASPGACAYVSSASTTTTPTTVATDASLADEISIAMVPAADNLTLSSPQGFTLRETSTDSTTGDAIGVADQFFSSASSAPIAATWTSSASTKWAWVTTAFN